MQIQAGQIAVITGAGSGIGRALARQLSAAGVHVSFCDVAEAALAETRALCVAGAPAGARVHAMRADVSARADMQAFRDGVLAAHVTDHIHLLFNNAGISGGGSFVTASPEDWERCFNICWHGVYLGARLFLPLLVVGPGGCIVNVSSVNGFFASLGPTTAHTAYSAAKFAVKGFTEALINDLRLNAPHVRCAVVMPGHVGTSIALNSLKVDQLSPEQLAGARQRLLREGLAQPGDSDEAIRQTLLQRALDFRDKAPTTADQAASIILDGVRADRWRILVGEDAALLDRMVRDDPQRAYEPEFSKAYAAARAALQAGPGLEPPPAIDRVF